MGIVNRRLDLFFAGGADPWSRWGVFNDITTFRTSRENVQSCLSYSPCNRWTVKHACMFMMGLCDYSSESDFLLKELLNHVTVEPISKGLAKAEFMGEFTRCDYDENERKVDVFHLTFPIVAYYKFARQYVFPNSALALDVPCFFMFHDMAKEDEILGKEGRLADAFEPLNRSEFLLLVSCLGGLNIHGVTVDDDGVTVCDGYLSNGEISVGSGVLIFANERNQPVIGSADCVLERNTAEPVQTVKCQQSVTEETPTEVSPIVDDVEIIEGVTVKDLRKILVEGAPITYVLRALAEYSKHPKQQSKEQLVRVLNNSASKYRWGTKDASRKEPSTTQINAVKMLMFPVGTGGKEKDFKI